MGVEWAPESMPERLSQPIRRMLTVRLLHTSDWHLGKRLHGVELLDHQAVFADWLVDVVRSEGVDAVIVAGDLYDRSNPPVTAIEVFDTAVARLAGTGVPLIMISGNHDSGTRVGTHAELLHAVGVHMRTDPARIEQPVMLSDAEGTVAIYGLPYLDPIATRSVLDTDAATHTAVLTAAMSRVHADLATRPGTRSVVVAHAFIAGGSTSDSERDVTVGGAPSVPVSLFSNVNYTALGHLHGPQTMEGTVRYSGSPLAYSFSEAGHTKSVSLIDLDASGDVTITEIPTPVPRPLTIISGTLDDVLANPAHTALEDHWVSVTLIDPLLPPGPMAQLRNRFPHALHLSHQPERTTEAMEATRAERIEGLQDRDVVMNFFVDQALREPDESEVAIIDEALDATRPGGSEH